MNEDTIYTEFIIEGNLDEFMYVNGRRVTKKSYIDAMVKKWHEKYPNQKIYRARLPIDGIVVSAKSERIK